MNDFKFKLKHIQLCLIKLYTFNRELLHFGGIEKTQVKFLFALLHLMTESFLSNFTIL